jgi:hypothetical protein
MSAPPSASDIQRQEPPPRQRPQASETFSPHSQNERALFGKRRSPPGTTSTAKTASIGDVQPSTFNLQPSTFNLQPSTFNLQPSTLNLQPSTFNLQPSTFNLQPSTFNLQPSTLQPLTHAPLPIRCEITLLDGRHIARHLDHLEDLLMVRGHIHGVQGIARFLCRHDKLEQRRDAC